MLELALFFLLMDCSRHASRSIPQQLTAGMLVFKQLDPTRTLNAQVTQET
jgi:hypothetical protein